MPTVKETIVFLLEHHKPTDVIVWQFWTVEDIQAVAEQENKRISKKQAEEVLEYMQNHWSASQGINWDVIKGYMDIVKEENMRTRK